MTRMEIKKILLALCSLVWINAQAQSDRDTLKMIRELNQVMSFAVNPYLHYADRTVIKGYDENLNENELVNIANFYKKGNDLFYGNDKEQVFLQDSFLINVNNARKTIQLNKIDAEAKKKINIMPLQKIDVQKMLKEKYTISMNEGTDDTASIVLQAKHSVLNHATIITLLYKKSSHLPISMEVDIINEQVASDELIAVISAKGINPEKLIQRKGDVNYITLTQKATVSFSQIDTTQQRAEEMPWWKDRISYDEKAQSFSGKGEWMNYDVIKTF